MPVNIERKIKDEEERWVGGKCCVLRPVHMTYIVTAQTVKRDSEARSPETFLGRVHNLGLSKTLGSWTIPRNVSECAYRKKLSHSRGDLAFLLQLKQ